MTDSPHSVYVEFAVPDAPADLYEGLIDALLERHPHSGPSAGPAGNGNLSVRLFVDAASVVDAVTRGIEYAQAAAMTQDITPDTVIGAEVITEAELDRRNAQPAVPELAGVTEAADIVGVTKQQISSLAKRMPLRRHVVQELAAGPVFLADGVRAYAATEHNATRGARISDLDLSPVERAILKLLHAMATQLPWSADTPAEHSADQALHVEEVLDEGRLRVHPRPAGDVDLEAVLGRLVEHRLLKTRKPYRAEQLPDHDTDIVVTVTDKGRRHAGAAAAGTNAR
ncbi:hypothetical protein ACFY2H_31405 [Streptomyces griseofuscus]|uniref:hypothetical protein n=1 Tax=Streptomycetaceae TaxID=2062 RepID=UPI00055DF6E7|nr:hypothetical protein [Actinacidiphila yeochonensis]